MTGSKRHTLDVRFSDPRPSGSARQFGDRRFKRRSVVEAATGRMRLALARRVPARRDWLAPSVFLHRCPAPKTRSYSVRRPTCDRRDRRLSSRSNRSRRRLPATCAWSRGGSVVGRRRDFLLSVPRGHSSGQGAPSPLQDNPTRLAPSVRRRIAAPLIAGRAGERRWSSLN